jgi:hypothetical protein
MILSRWIKRKDKIDIGTNGLLKRNIALKLFNNTKLMLSLILIASLALMFSGSNKFSFEYQDIKLTIPAISPGAANAILALITMILSNLLTERSIIISYYFGSTIKNDELENPAGKTDNKQDNTDSE